ncbi:MULTISPECIES: type II toxin-antitoxin system RelE/ParE family toxin [Methylobacterium]|uniref:type II toxin-antitoxin system RelE/ParE family toxin n=1 Tax=Methylobacterium TaxID=407 RepID=UPI0024847A4A|nr:MULTISPECIES: type II toxin-antitoxin system RelE/ParE family toxin [Methylobacterium]
MGRPRPDLRPDIRSFPHRNYVIYFRVRDDVLEVINILHSRRDLADRFASPEEP